MVFLCHCHRPTDIVTGRQESWPAANEEFRGFANDDDYAEKVSDLNESCVVSGISCTGSSRPAQIHGMGYPDTCLARDDDDDDCCSSRHS